VWILLALAAVPASAQDALTSYQNAERFLGGNLQRLITVAEVRPHWIGQGDRFWYLQMEPQGRHFILVDPADSTTGPAFDQTRLAAALSRAAGRKVEADSLPFYEFEFSTDGHSIHFEADDAHWSCSLQSYECTKEPAAAGPHESLSPDGHWAAFVRDHNLYVRDVSTGAVVQLTRDGVAGWDYATPLPDLRALVSEKASRGEDVEETPDVYWSPDSNALITYRLDSRNAGRFTSLQYVPPDQLRPRAYDYVYPLPGEVLPTAQPIVFDLLSQSRIDVNLRLSAIASRNGDVQQVGLSIGSKGDFSAAEGLHEQAKSIAGRAVALLSAPTVKGGSYTVVLDPVLAGVFVHEAFGHLSEADHIYENPQLRDIMVLGRRFGKKHLNIVDGAAVPGLRGSFKYDDEGTPATKTYLITEGVLTSRLRRLRSSALSLTSFSSSAMPASGLPER
jgi:hypothetical protein